LVSKYLNQRIEKFQLEITDNFLKEETTENSIEGLKEVLSRKIDIRTKNKI
jgi:predicted DNA-binding protein